MKNLIVLDGEFISVGQRFFDSLSPGVLRKKGVFETMRAYGGVIFAFDEHYHRLAQGLRHFSIHLPFTREKIKEYLYSSLSKNRLQSARLRLNIWQANGKTRLAIAVLPFYPLSDAKYRAGFKAVIASKRLQKRIQLGKIKSLRYSFFLKAFEEARKEGYDESILLDERGLVVEGSRSNIFLVKGNTLLTPGLASGCLQGITRRFILQLAKKKGLRCHETMVSPEEVFHADEVFLTNSIIEVMPVTSLDGKLISKGKAGSVTLKLVAAYRAMT